MANLFWHDIFTLIITYTPSNVVAGRMQNVKKKQPSLTKKLLNMDWSMSYIYLSIKLPNGWSTGIFQYLQKSQ